MLLSCVTSSPWFSAIINKQGCLPVQGGEEGSCSSSGAGSDAGPGSSSSNRSGVHRAGQADHSPHSALCPRSHGNTPLSHRLAPRILGGNLGMTGLRTEQVRGGCPEAGGWTKAGHGTWLCGHQSRADPSLLLDASGPWTGFYRSRSQTPSAHPQTPPRVPHTHTAHTIWVHVTRG